MKIRNDKNEEWKSDNVSRETGNNITIKSEESNLTGAIKNGSPVNLRKLLQLKHNQDFNSPKNRE
jgi:hypothetical protein